MQVRETVLPRRVALLRREAIPARRLGGVLGNTLTAKVQIADRRLRGRIALLRARARLLKKPTGSSSGGASAGATQAFHPMLFLTILVKSKDSEVVETSPARYPEPARIQRWKLGEAKARFSEVVRLAAAGQPQRVTVHGRNAVVVVAADEFDRLRARRTAASLHDLLSRSPLNRLEFGGGSVRSPVREVEL